MNKPSQSTEKTVAIGWVQAIIAGGTDKAQLLARAGIAVLPTDPLARIPLDAVVRLWRAAAELTGDAAFGLHMGQSIEPTSFNVLAYTLVSSTILREAFGHLQRFQRLVSDGARLQLIEQNGLAWLVYHPIEASLRFAPLQVEAVLACAVRLLRWMMGFAFSPQRICITHAATSPSGVYRDILGCDPEFQSEFNGLGLPLSWLDALLPARNPELCRLHESLARQHLSTLESSAASRRGLPRHCKPCCRRGRWARSPPRPCWGCPPGVCSSVFPVKAPALLKRWTKCAIRWRPAIWATRC